MLSGNIHMFPRFSLGKGNQPLPLISLLWIARKQLIRTYIHRRLLLMKHYICVTIFWQLAPALQCQILSIFTCGDLDWAVEARIEQQWFVQSFYILQNFVLSFFKFCSNSSPSATEIVLVYNGSSFASMDTKSVSKAPLFRNLLFKFWNNLDGAGHYAPCKYGEIYNRYHDQSSEGELVLVHKLAKLSEIIYGMEVIANGELVKLTGATAPLEVREEVKQPLRVLKNEV